MVQGDLAFALITSFDAYEEEVASDYPVWVPRATEMDVRALGHQLYLDYRESGGRCPVSL